jgi:hypothetical protein
MRLCTRAQRCLGHLDTVEALLGAREVELMAHRSFGRACLADVRRRATHFVMDSLRVPEDDPMRLGCSQADGALATVWDGPAQPRPLGEVVDEILELLARGPCGPPGRRRSPEAIAAPDLERASLGEVAACVFGCLAPRERELLERRFGAPDGESPSLAALAARLGLTRERVRQIVSAALARLARDEERLRRRPLTALLLAEFEGRGGVLREGDVAEALRRRFRGRAAIARALSRVLLTATPAFQQVRGEIWCASAVTTELARATLERLHLLLRRAQRPATLRQLAGGFRQEDPRAPRSEALLAACLASDRRFRTCDARRYGLREWEWGVPRSLEEALVACLRVDGRALAVPRLTERVNQVLQPERAASPVAVAAALARDPVFRRVRTGVYALAGGRPAPPPFAR